MGLIGMAKWALGIEPPTLGYGGFDGEDRWEGPDDLWPEEPSHIQAVAEQIDEIDSSPDIIVTRQWGLVLPSGEIKWNEWQGVTFADPMDRMRMIAALQRTAMDVGFAEYQVNDFLAGYSWVTRNQIAAVAYEDEGAFALTDSAVSSTDTPRDGKSHDRNESDADANGDAASNLPRNLRPGSMGGDAQ